MTFTFNRSRRARLIAGLMALAFVAVPSSVWALECSTLDRHGLPRDCTPLEDVGQCMANAADSFHQCREAYPWYLEGKCVQDIAIDWTACALASPIRTILR